MRQLIAVLLAASITLTQLPAAAMAAPKTTITPTAEGTKIVTTNDDKSRVETLISNTNPARVTVTYYDKFGKPLGTSVTSPSGVSIQKMTIKGPVMNIYFWK